MKRFAVWLRAPFLGIHSTNTTHHYMTAHSNARRALAGALLKELTFEELCFKFVFLHQPHDEVFIMYGCATVYPHATLKTRDLAESLEVSKPAWIRLEILDEKFKCARCLISGMTNIRIRIPSEPKLDRFLFESPCPSYRRPTQFLSVSCRRIILINRSSFLCFKQSLGQTRAPSKSFSC